MKKIAIIAITIALMSCILSVFAFADSTTEVPSEPENISDGILSTYYLDGGYNEGKANNNVDYIIYTIEDIENYIVPVKDIAKYDLKSAYFPTAEEGGYYEYALSDTVSLYLYIDYTIPDTPLYKFYCAESNLSTVSSGFIGNFLGDNNGLLLYFDTSGALNYALFGKDDGIIYSHNIVSSTSLIKTCIFEKGTYAYYIEGGSNIGNTYIDGYQVVSYIDYQLLVINDISKFRVPYFYVDHEDGAYPVTDERYSFRSRYFMHAVTSMIYRYNLSDTICLSTQVSLTDEGHNFMYYIRNLVTKENVYFYEGEVDLADGDFMLYLNTNGELCYAIYDWQGLVISNGVCDQTALEWLTPFIFSITSEGNHKPTYEDGYNIGYQEGYWKGYEDCNGSHGFDEEYFNEKIEAAYNEGYENGRAGGKSEIISSVYKDAQYWYNLGLRDGQDTDDIVSNSISGFFKGMTSFFSPFLSIGIGSLTVYSVLGLSIIMLLVMTIIKVVRK